ncbi:hypothetical protein K474DRAFT_1610123 [Panus rudis PR-1116 ss-1]|nr:hypothetical protein K474DRAFT_1610123 [Panus rudis PR-1116 ss-1]
MSLGWRPHDFKGTVNDFKNYYMVLKDLFRSPYIAHSALRKGGIVWRIAVQVLQDGYPWDQYNHTEDILTHAELLSGQGCMFVDEGTTEEEDNLISGMYKVQTYQGDKQTSDCSWWPLQHTWNRSPYDAGYWTPKAESWFQSHLSKILSGEAKVKSAKVWRHDLKRNKHASMVFQRNELASQVFIASTYK